MSAYRPAWLEISPANLQYNCETVKKNRRGSGKGVCRGESQRLRTWRDRNQQSLFGSRRRVFLAVAMLTEAMELREAGVHLPHSDIGLDAGGRL